MVWIKTKTKIFFVNKLIIFANIYNIPDLKGWGFEKESNNCHVVLEQKCKMAKFQSDFFWFNNKKFDNFWYDLFRNRDGFCSMFYRYTMHSEDKLKFLNSFYMNRTRKPTKEALIRVDKRCPSFLVSFFFIYYSARFNQITGNHYWQDLQ